MYIITVLGKESEGAYSVMSDDGEHVLYMFEDEDDAVRYAMLLEEDRDFPEMHVIEVDDEMMFQLCELNDYRYAVISKNDIVIPPEHHDYI